MKFKKGEYLLVVNDDIPKYDGIIIKYEGIRDEEEYFLYKHKGTIIVNNDCELKNYTEYVFKESEVRKITKQEVLAYII